MDSRAYDIWRKNKFSVIVHHYLSGFVNKRRSAKNLCERAYGSYVNSKLSRCTSNKNFWNALEGLDVNQKLRPSVAHINLDELNNYFISLSDGAALDVSYAMNGIKRKAIGDDGISVEFLKKIFEFVAYNTLGELID
jgi:hypothetical protein